MPVLYNCALTDMNLILFYHISFVHYLKIIIIYCLCVHCTVKDNARNNRRCKKLDRPAFQKDKEGDTLQNYQKDLIQPELGMIVL